MTDIKQLIHLNVEIEGLLKVLADRDSIEAKSLLAKKIKDYVQMIDPIIDGVNTANDPDEVASVAEAAHSLADDATYVEVKEQEAQEGEDTDETDLATAAIERGEKHRNNLRSLLTINDKYYFIKEVFGGNEDDFNATLDIVGEMDSFKEAQNYISEDLMLDPSNPAVADLLDRIAENF